MSKNSSVETKANYNADAANTTASFTSKITDNIPVSYNAYDENVVFTNDKIIVSFNIIFGKGKDALEYNDEKELKQFTKKYNVDTLENDDTKAYYIIADEGPLLIQIDNLDIYSRYNNEKYDYALGFAVDFEEPEYVSNEHYSPFNIERDGVLWSIPATNHYNNTFYQNGKAKYQWNTSRAKDSNVELTEDEKEIGIEKTSETTGLLYMTFMVLSKEKEIVQQREITRSCNTRSAGVTRGSGATQGINDSVAGRVGYGHSASTSSTASTFKYAKNTSRVVIPVRIRISKDSEVTDMNCSKTLKGAEVNMNRKKIVTPSFDPLL